jgi:hypothetical protein
MDKSRLTRFVKVRVCVEIDERSLRMAWRKMKDER